MMRHASEFAARGVPFVFDPGQAMPMFSAEELEGFVAQAQWVAVNDYEGHLLSEKMGLSLSQLAERLSGGLIVTRGAEGVEVFEQSGHKQVKGIDVQSLLGASPVDPTGCGDAFRGGLLYGLAQGATLADSAMLGNLLGALKVVHRGAQNHSIDRKAVAALMQKLYPETAARLSMS
jgi:adenosine kinase